MPKQTDEEDKLAFEPPEPGYIAEKQVFLIPMSESRLRTPWGLRLYAEELIKERLGDDAQITSVKLKSPKLISKAKAKISRQEPPARLCVTIKF